MKVYSIYILNKAGGLIYQNDVSPQLNRLTANDYLVLAGTLHGVHAITSKFTTSIHSENVPTTPNSAIVATGKAHSPNTNRTGLQSIETELFNLYMYQTLTGIKFVIITQPNAANSGPSEAEKALSRGELSAQIGHADDIFKQLYVLYSDYVMKDPFYSLDMPIKSQLFDAGVAKVVAS